LYIGIYVTIFSVFYLFVDGGSRLTRVCFIFIILFSFLSAESLEEKQRELQKIQTELYRQKYLLQQTKRKEQNSLRNLYLINRKIRIVKGSLDQNQQKLKTQVRVLEQTKAEVNKNTDDFQLLQKLVAKRIRENYKSQELDFLTLFFSQKSFSDIIDSSYYYRKILEKDIENINRLSSIKKEILRKKSILEYQKRIIENTNRNIQQQKRIYESRAVQQQQLYSNIRAQRQEYERKVDGLLRNSKEIETMIKKIIQENSVRQSLGSGKFIWPIRGAITSYYGLRRHPIFRTIRMHTGLDVGSRTGNRIVATDAGIVIFSGWWGGYGRAIIIDHGHGYSSVYGHMSKLLVNRGQAVEKYQVIGLIGSSGYSTGPHLHFEIRYNGETQDPLRYLP